MGSLIREVALARGHEIVATIDVNNLEDFDSDKFRSADVAIEFTRPDQALSNYAKAWKQGVPVVSGTTGWGSPAATPEVLEACSEHGATLFHAPNFSIGLNVASAANRLIAKLLSPFDSYTPSIHEVHHIHKLDHPSGTAIKLADDVIGENERIAAWTESEADTDAADKVVITHERRGEVAGIHTVCWDSDVDTITLTHDAKSRMGFAKGAVVAAEWVVNQPKGRIYSMADMLKF